MRFVNGPSGWFCAAANCSARPSPRRRQVRAALRALVSRLRSRKAIDQWLQEHTP